MAKVTVPSDTLATFQTIGKSICLRNRKEGYTVSKVSRPRFVSLESEELVFDQAKATLGEWRGLTDGQRQEWQELGLVGYMDGIDLFMREGWKAGLQSIYGYARYGQNVYMKG